MPTGVKHITVTLDGAGSNTRPGGRVTGDLEVSDKWVLYILVGQAGKAPSGQTGGGTTTGGGGAGGGGNTQGGGWSGGGATFIRVNSTTGTVKAVAGGAGGDSGDNGPGGDGGGLTGRSGRPGTSGTSGGVPPVGNATGGTQAQGGNGGTSPSGTQFNGAEAVDTVLAVGGKGGEAGSSTPCYGGGGGGGGYHPGGGGQAAATGYAPGGGGGGGSNYVGGLTGAQPGGQQGTGGTGNGSVTLNYLSSGARNQPPTPPSEPEINDKAAEEGHLTKSTGSVKIDALVNDPDSGEEVYLVARWSTSSTFTTLAGSTISKKVARNHRVAVTLTGLSQNTHYYVRLYTKDEHGLYSTSYNTVDFWTNRKSFTSDMTVNTQGSGMTLPSLSSATFSWIHNDPDPSDYQTGFELRYRVAASSVRPVGAWKTEKHDVGKNLPPKVPGPPSSAKNEWVFDPEFFKGNTFYEWQVRTKDGQGLWGDFGAELFTFFVSSTSAPPRLLTPPHLTPVDMQKPTTFTWRFVDPEVGDTQKKADLRYRAIGHTKTLSTGLSEGPGEWVTLLGDLTPGVPGLARSWTLEPGRFVDGYTYEWEVRSYDTIGATISDWSDPFRFYAINTPGAEAGGLPVGQPTLVQGELGCGSYRVFIYQQGGQIRIGEVEPIDRMSFKRVRDDISNCLVHSSGYSVDCGALYGTVRSWIHELVVFRDGVRVWEGPITRITYTTTSVEFEAKDVMAYVYRRIMRQGYNDAYRLTRDNPTGIPDEYLGLLSAVRRATMIITQALAPYDPNVLPYLTAIEYPDDAQESRVVANFSRSAWEEVDDLAATAGIDYTVVGRRIMVWDTHRAIGRLPELRDGDFSDSPIVTEYGMQLATFFAVTNGSGVVGFTEVQAKTYPYGPIEQLASAYNDSAAASDEVQTPEALEKARQAMTEQSKRNISGRWPTPLVVRIPDNSSLSPRVNIGFQQLIPGVWLPLRSVNTPRQVTQWQKLDSVDVDVEGNAGEVVKVVLSPAPNGGNDPDTAQEPGDGIPAGGGGDLKVWPPKMLSMYLMMYDISGSPRLSTLHGNVNTLRMAFAVGDPPALVGPASEGSFANFQKNLQPFRDRGGKVVVSVGGEGNVVNIAARDRFVSGIMDIHKMIPLDGLDWDLEGPAMALADVLAISTNLADRIPGFGISMVPGDVDVYLPIAVELEHAGLLTRYGQQFYDAPVSQAAMMFRIDEAVDAGINPAHIDIGMSSPTPTDANHWTVQQCIDNFNAAEAKYPTIGGAYFWEASMTNAQDWCNRVGNVVLH